MDPIGSKLIFILAYQPTKAQSTGLSLIPMMKISELSQSVSRP